MKDKPYDPFYIEVQHVAAPFPYTDSLPFLQAHADRLGIAIHWEYDDKLIIATPDTAWPVEIIIKGEFQRFHDEFQKKLFAQPEEFQDEIGKE